MFQKLTLHTIRHRIALEIRQAILSGALHEGERLVERKLASALGSSLTSVREALIELESEGFIFKKINLGTYVNKMSLEDIEKVFEVRRALESFAIAEAARRGTAEQIAELEKTYFDMLDAARVKDARAFNRYDMQWHLHVWRMTGNEYLEAALRRAVLPFFAFVAIRISSLDPLSLLRDAYGHLPLIEAVKARDAEKARQAFASTVDTWLSITRAEFAQRAELDERESSQPAELVSNIQPTSSR